MATKTLRTRALRIRRHQRVRRQVSGTTERPRLVVHRTARHISAQVIDDTTGRTIVSASTVEKDLRSVNTEAGKVSAATAIGKTVAERAKGAGVSKVVFDRGGYEYHGRVAALADAARNEGLEF
jgi:large subunit ribosomal protein L18